MKQIIGTLLSRPMLPVYATKSIIRDTSSCQSRSRKPQWKRSGDATSTGWIRNAAATNRIQGIQQRRKARNRDCVVIRCSHCGDSFRTRTQVAFGYTSIFKCVTSIIQGPGSRGLLGGRLKFNECFNAVQPRGIGNISWPS